ncbi:MAG: filamentous hemagglutinin N-terminal domain-containing protein [Betaproteobacteria bacterium]|nr:filamentous hemagglutinin N-terminal domain-containing protein [Betaproteobacteria bacterium]
MHSPGSLNRFYRLVWSVAAHCWQVAPENSRGCCKSGRPGVAATLTAIAIIAISAGNPTYGASPAPAPVVANQLPQGGVVAAGQAAISLGANSAAMDVTQTSQRTVINWNSFNLGSAASIVFNQPGSSAVTLNRVLDGQPSAIFGRITAPGQVFISNPGGVYFGATASVDVGGLVATTHSISDADLMAGRYLFKRDGSSASVVNDGQLKTALGGYIALLAPEVRNSGVIVARAGTVALAAGEAISLNFDGQQTLAGITTTPATIATLVENRNAVLAPGGLIILSANALASLQAGVIRNSGRLDASSLVSRGGKIMLEGDDITLAAGSRLDASGATGGGTVLVGGDWQGSGEMRQASKVTMDAGATIDASATDKGDGGKVVLWSENCGVGWPCRRRRRQDRNIGAFAAHRRPARQRSGQPGQGRHLAVRPLRCHDQRRHQQQRQQRRRVDAKRQQLDDSQHHDQQFVERWHQRHRHHCRQRHTERRHHGQQRDHKIQRQRRCHADAAGGQYDQDRPGHQPQRRHWQVAHQSGCRQQQRHARWRRGHHFEQQPQHRRRQSELRHRRHDHAERHQHRGRRRCLCGRQRCHQPDDRWRQFHCQR